MIAVSYHLHWWDPFTLKSPFYCVFIVLDFRHMWRVRTRPSQQPPFKPSAGAPPTSLRWRTLASTVWCCCSPTEMVESPFWTVDSDSFLHRSCLIVFGLNMFLQRLWWLRAWWWSRSCCRLNPPSTVRSSSTWPSSLITSLYASQFLYPLLIHIPSYQHKMAVI